MLRQNLNWFSVRKTCYRKQKAQHWEHGSEKTVLRDCERRSGKRYVPNDKVCNVEAQHGRRACIQIVFFDNCKVPSKQIFFFRAKLPQDKKPNWHLKQLKAKEPSELSTKLPPAGSHLQSRNRVQHGCGMSLWRAISPKFLFHSLSSLTPPHKHAVISMEFSTHVLSNLLSANTHWSFPVHKKSWKYFLLFFKIVWSCGLNHFVLFLLLLEGTRQTVSQLLLFCTQLQGPKQNTRKKKATDSFQASKKRWCGAGRNSRRGVFCKRTWSVEHLAEKQETRMRMHDFDWMTHTDTSRTCSKQIWLLEQWINEVSFLVLVAGLRLRKGTPWMKWETNCLQGCPCIHQNNNPRSGQPADFFVFLMWTLVNSSLFTVHKAREWPTNTTETSSFLGTWKMLYAPNKPCGHRLCMCHLFCFWHWHRYWKTLLKSRLLDSVFPLTKCTPFTTKATAIFVGCEDNLKLVTSTGMSFFSCFCVPWSVFLTQTPQVKWKTTIFHFTQP